MKKIAFILCVALCSFFTAKAQFTAQPTGEFVNLHTEDVQPKAISENGEWACGAAMANSESAPGIADKMVEAFTANVGELTGETLTRG